VKGGPFVCWPTKLGFPRGLSVGEQATDTAGRNHILCRRFLAWVRPPATKNIRARHRHRQYAEEPAIPPAIRRLPRRCTYHMLDGRLIFGYQPRRDFCRICGVCSDNLGANRNEKCSGSDHQCGNLGREAAPYNNQGKILETSSPQKHL